MSEVLSYEVIGKIRSKKAPINNRTRKALQVLQVSASDLSVLVASPGTMPKKTLEPSKESLKISKHDDDDIKETLPRRSKRKNQNAENQDTVETSKEKSSSSKMKLPRAPKLKKVSNAKKSGKQTVLRNQPLLDSYISEASKSTNASTTVGNSVSSSSTTFSKKDLEDTIMAGTNTAFSEKDLEDTMMAGESTMRVIKSVSDEVDMLTSDTPPNTMYWKLVAEQHQKALEIALRENAQIKDELLVLDTENGQLKELLQEAERVIEIVKASLA